MAEDDIMILELLIAQKERKPSKNEKDISKESGEQIERTPLAKYWTIEHNRLYITK